eukprot:12727220-Heterocapsa_arctica.AAC.1
MSNTDNNKYAHGRADGVGGHTSERVVIMLGRRPSQNRARPSQNRIRPSQIRSSQIQFWRVRSTSTR